MKLRLVASALMILALGCGATPATAPVTVVVIAPPSPAIAVDPAGPEPPPTLEIAGGGWSLAHGDAARTGHVEAPVIRAPRLIWRAKIGIQGWLNAPVIAGSLVVVPSSGDAHNASDPRDGVVGIDLASGRPRWHAHLGGDAIGVAVSGDRAIVGSDDGRVTALDLRSGAPIWSVAVSGKAYASPLPIGDQVIVGDASGVVRALGIADGAPRWQVRLKGAIRGGASADASAIYAVSQGGEAIALRPDGSTIWRVELGRVAPGASFHEAYAAPMVTGSLLIVPFARDTYYDTPAVLALDRRSGKLAWLAKGKGPSDWGNVRMTPALSGGALVWPEAYSGDVVGLDATSGTVRFRSPVGACFFPSWASPASARDVVYAPRFDGSIYAVSAASGSVLWRVYLGEERRASVVAPSGGGAIASCTWDVPSGAPLYSPPAIADDGTVIVGSGEGFVYAIGEAR
ncbi:MAG: PQQ-binding-like beta-propeller repeat protein [Byssovorax sp.]